ncbi:MAG: BadF/BadG/BcrA/BcrD ATPase family protein [Eubacteriales bacterium]|nr:BadF/BadG/BcrA/BcrD ATPase family protein [Eubacteriales bacterium]MDY4897961.1 BadF/BadG/BcrA/BcrD ATPase family protein [Eubacteriales bacterium]
MQNVIGIDVGGSTTKIVGFRKDGVRIEMIQPQFVRAADPITSVYGAFGRFTSQNGLELSDIDCVMMTGVGSTFVQKPIYSLDCRAVSEFSSVGLGGLYLSGLDEAIVVSMGTGTALIHATHRGGETKTEYLGGTGVGGGTLIGLSRKILGVDTIEHIEQLCEGGDLNKIDLRIKDISDNSLFPSVNHELTASNFGKLSDIAGKHDIALGIANMVAETIAMVSIFAARGHGLRDIVLTGNLSCVSPVRKIIMGLSESFGVNFVCPDNAQFATVIGAALLGLDG